MYKKVTVNGTQYEVCVATHINTMRWPGDIDTDYPEGDERRNQSPWYTLDLVPMPDRMRLARICRRMRAGLERTRK